MKKLAFLLSTLCLCAAAWAADLSRLPSGYDWAVRLDILTGGESPLIARVLDALFPRNREALAGRIRLFKIYSGIDLSQDLDEVIFFGNRQLDDPDLIYATGRFNIQQIDQTFAMAGTRKEVYRKINIHTYRIQNGKVYYLARPAPGIFLAGNRKESVLRAVDCVAGARRGLPAGAPSAHALVRAKSRIAAMYTGNPQQFAVNPILAAGLSLARSADLTLDSPGRDRVDFRVVLHTDSPQAAQGMQQAVLAAKGLCLYRKEPRELAMLASAAQVAVKGGDVHIHVPMNAQMAVKLCKSMQLHQIGQVSAQDIRNAETFLKRKSGTPKSHPAPAPKKATPPHVR
ncbi:MAG: hypothetical protein J6Z49_04970 [Kiritimatiellae bacterium]|nr:hypothetical protein [Kiritimatiellia bacterium]